MTRKNILGTPVFDAQKYSGIFSGSFSGRFSGRLSGNYFDFVGLGQGVANRRRATDRSTRFSRSVLARIGSRGPQRRLLTLQSNFMV